MSLEHDLAEGGHLALEPLRDQVKHEVEGLEMFALHLVTTAVAWRESRRTALKAVGHILTKDMRKQIGDYQDQHGNYPAWAPLAESTLDEKARLGVTPRAGMDDDAPLYREGDLLKSFRSSVEGSEEVYAGSTDPVMEYHEFGTSKMPPRPVVGPALFKNIEDIRAVLGYAVMDTVVSGQRLGYRFNAALGGIADPEDKA